MFDKILHVGDKLEVRRLNYAGNEIDDGKYYLSTIMEIIDEYRIGIAMPVENGGLVPLDIGEKYKLSFFGPGGIYQCKGIVKERYKSAPFYVAVIRFTSDLEKIQRRQFFRLECVLDMLFRRIPVIPEDGKQPDNPGEWQKGITIDISGGGIRFNDRESRPDDRFYQIRFNIVIDNNPVEVTTYARIVYISDLPGKTGLYEYRAEFVNISDKLRETIVRFVFDEDRKRRKKDIK